MDENLQALLISVAEMISLPKQAIKHYAEHTASDLPVSATPSATQFPL